MGFSILKRALVPAMAVGLVAALVFSISPGPSAALPDYTTKTGQACGVCHVNPAGGGALTSVGQRFAAVATHASDPAGAFAQISATPPPSPTQAPTPAPAPAVALSVAFSGASTDDSVIYTIRVVNTGSADISNIFVAGSIPSGAIFGAAVNTPASAGFFSSSGGAAAWLMGTLSASAGSNAAIFSYRVSKGTASNLTASAFAHWLAPSEGTAASVPAAPITGDQRAAVDEAVKVGLTNLDRSTTLWNIQPGLGTVMIEYNIRFANLWFAAQAGNWDFARYQIAEMTEIQEVGETTRPARAPALKNFEDTFLEPLDEASVAKDISAFVTAYDAAVGGCNSCHASSTNVPPNRTIPAKFIKVTRPSAPVFPNVDFKGQ